MRREQRHSLLESRSTTYDPQCYALAAHFLADDHEAGLTPEQRKARCMSLACAIQDAVEDWIEDELQRRLAQ